MKKINLKEKYALFNEHWTPKIIAELNGQQVKLAKLKGSFVWHSHAEEDELFFVVKGTLHIEFRDQSQTLQEGEMIVVPAGVEHRPHAPEEAWVMLFEPISTRHTGGVQHELTKEKLSWI